MAEWRDDVHNRLLGGIFNPGTQWTEARGASRLLDGNPWAQEALVRSIAGLHKIATEGWEPNQAAGPNSLGQAEVVEGLKNTLRYMREHFPEWASLTPVELDGDFHLPTYPGCTPFVKSYIEDVVLEGDFDRGGIE